MDQRAKHLIPQTVVISGGDLSNIGAAQRVLALISSLPDGVGNVLIQPLRAQPGSDVVREMRKLFGRAMLAGRGGYTVTLADGCGQREFDLGIQLCSGRYHALHVPSEIQVFEGKSGFDFLVARGELPLCVKLITKAWE